MSPTSSPNVQQAVPDDAGHAVASGGVAATHHPGRAGGPSPGRAGRGTVVPGAACPGEVPLGGGDSGRAVDDAFRGAGDGTGGMVASRSEVLDLVSVGVPARTRTLPTTVTVLVAAQKGGVGKTTLVGHLAAAAGLVGLNVLAVDCDPQATLSVEGFGGEPRPGVAAAILRLLDGGRADLLDELVDGVAPNVDLAPTAHEPMRLVRDRLSGSASDRGELRRVLDGLRDCYDLILIDTPPELGVISELGLAADDVVHVVAVADQGTFSLRPLLELHAFIQRADHDGRSVWLGVAFNKHASSQLNAQLIDQFSEAERELLRPFGTRIPLRAAIPNAQMHGLQVVLTDRRSDATVAFEELLAEILQRALRLQEDQR